MPVDVQGVVLDLKVVDLGHHFLNTLDPGIAEFKELIAVHADQVVVLPVAVGALILGLFVTKLMFDNQVTVDKKVECVVHRRPAYANAVLLQFRIQLVGVKMNRTLIDFFQNREPFRRLPLIAVLQEIAEDPANLLLLTLRNK